MVDAGQVVDKGDLGRFELEVEGKTAIAAYHTEGDTLVFTHTEVPGELEGRGVGSRLVEGALAIARERGLRIVPACSFVRHYVESHPQARDLVAQ